LDYKDAAVGVEGLDWPSVILPCTAKDFVSYSSWPGVDPYVWTSDFNFYQFSQHQTDPTYPEITPVKH